MLRWANDFPETARAVADGIAAGWHLGGQLYVSLQGRTVLDVAVGHSEPGRLMSSDDLMLWLSAGKPVTAIALAALLERQRIEVNQRVAEFLPGFGQAGKGEVTIRHLLTHTAGFRTADALPETLEWNEMLAAIDMTPLEAGWTLGEKAGYHLAATWFVLGALIEHLVDGAFAQYLHAEFLGSAGLSDTFAAMESSTFARLAQRIVPVYTTFGGKLDPHPFWNSADYCARPRPGSNLRGPVRSLGRFYEQLLGFIGSTPKGWPSEAAVHVWTSRQRTGLYDHTLKGEADWAYGFLMQPKEARTLGQAPYSYGAQSSPATFGHSGNQCSSAFADPAHGLVVAWVFNGRPGERLHQIRAAAMNRAIYADLALGG